MSAQPDKPSEATSTAPNRLQMKRWLRALSIAKILFEEEGYHTVYLEEIEQRITRSQPLPQVAKGESCYRKRKKRPKESGDERPA